MKTLNNKTNLREAAFRYHAFSNNNVLDRNHPEHNEDFHRPYEQLAKLFKQHGYALKTSDMSKGNPIFTIDLDVQDFCENSFQYLLMLETIYVNPKNRKIPEFYRKVFTWNDSLVDGDRFIKINFPNTIRVLDVPEFIERDKFCCLIAANKSVKQYDHRELYSERVNIIRWFEQNHPSEIDLYGIGWDMPVVSNRIGNKIKSKIWRLLNLGHWITVFPSYKGIVEKKESVLLKTKFTICYENVHDIPGYITEKIFDAFMSGCIPVYWGASNISDYIPASCFIDRRNFSTNEELYQFMKIMDASTYSHYQSEIKKFLKSEASYSYGSDYFVETICNSITSDINSLKISSNESLDSS